MLWRQAKIWGTMIHQYIIEVEIQIEHLQEQAGMQFQMPLKNPGIRTILVLHTFL